MTHHARIEDLLRTHAPRVLGVLVGRYGDFDAAEDAVQEALLAAAVRWPVDGTPDNPRGWLIQTASRKLYDQTRSDQARRRREQLAARLDPPPEGPDDNLSPDVRDDTLTLLFLCCHPSLTPASAIALTLRAVGGLTTAQIASAFLVPEATMAQRISRAKQRIKATGAQFRMPDAAEWPARLRTVLHVLYLIFNEGYVSSSGADLHRVELSTEAIRLTRIVHRMLPEDGEVAGLLALMLLTDARRPARTDASGEIVPLAEQDRALWDRAQIVDGTAILDRAVRDNGTLGEYQLQAAIAALHDRAGRFADTDWPQILALYDQLARMTGSPVVEVNRAIAAAMVHGPDHGLRMLEPLDARLPGHRLAAVRAHLAEMAGDRDAAIGYYRAAASATTSLPERRYLTTRAAQLRADPTDPSADT